MTSIRRSDMTTPHRTLREAAQMALDALLTGYHQGTQDAIAALREALAAPEPEPVAWEGAEEWEQLAWHLCADENGEDACNELIWEGGPIKEPWGERWLKYEDEAKRMIALVRKYAAPPAAPAPAAPVVPIDMVLHCPACGLQHIDAPEDADCDGEVVHSFGWANPPHRSHLCRPEDGGCGHIWRPADVPTNGVAAVATKGKADSPITAPVVREPLSEEWIAQFFLQLPLSYEQVEKIVRHVEKAHGIGGGNG